MPTRTPLVLVSAAAALAVAGCSSATTTAAPAPTATTTTASPTATTTGGTVTVTSAVPAGSVAPKGGAGCPVSEATLLKALRSSAVSKFLAPTDTLTGITCYQGYALGLTHPRQADNAEVVFHYTGGAWHAVNGGTAGYCDGVVPAAVRPHLKHC